MLKLISWNIDSLNAALTSASPRAEMSREVLNTIKKEDADFIFPVIRSNGSAPSRRQGKAMREQ